MTRKASSPVPSRKTPRTGSGRVRAHFAADKEERRACILKAGLQLFLKHDLGEVTMDAIARASRLAKGTLYLYFPTKESLFLELLDGELSAWFESLEMHLGSLAERGPEEIARIVVATLGERPHLPRLLSHLHHAIERNVPDADLLEFKNRLRARMARAALILKPEPAGPGETAALRPLLGVHAIVVGVWQSTSQSKSMGHLLESNGLGMFAVDFETLLQHTLEAFFRGLVRS